MEEKKPFSVRWDNFKFALWEYYRWPIIVGVTVVLILGGMIYSFFNRQETAFYGIMINGNLLKGDALAEEFREYAELDPEDRMVLAGYTMDLLEYEATIATMDMLFATTTSRELDVVILDAVAFGSLSNQALYTDLNQVLSAEELEQLGERVWYLDRADLTDTVTEEPPPVDLDTDASYMDEPVPVAVEISDSEKIRQYSFYSDSGCFFTVANSSERKATAAQFLQFLMEE